MLNGIQLGGQSIRLSWGRSPTNKQVEHCYVIKVADLFYHLFIHSFIYFIGYQPQQDSGQWNGSYYGYNQGYSAYGYAAPDPNTFAYTGYPGYGNFQQQQQPPQVKAVDNVISISLRLSQNPNHYILQYDSRNMNDLGNNIGNDNGPDTVTKFQMHDILGDHTDGTFMVPVILNLIFVL